LAAVLWAAIWSQAWAGPPYETDDPEPVDYRNYEIYLHSDYHRVGPQIGGSLSTLEINYGPLPNTQFSLAIPLAFSPPPGQTQSGLGDIDVGLKYRFVPETAAMPQIAFYPSATLATGNPARDLGGGHGTFFLPLWAQKSIGKWTIFGGGGLELEGGNQTSWQDGLAVTRDVTEALNVGVEVFHQTPDTFQPGYTDVGFGVIQGIGKYHAFLFSFGRALAPASIHGYAAYGWRLGP
jgi:hypothetical protein